MGEPADWVTKLAPCEALVGADCTRLLDAVATLCPALHSHGAWLGENCSHADEIPWKFRGNYQIPDFRLQPTRLAPDCKLMAMLAEAGLACLTARHGDLRAVAPPSPGSFPHHGAGRGRPRFAARGAQLCGLISIYHL